MNTILFLPRLTVLESLKANPRYLVVDIESRAYPSQGNTLQSSYIPCPSNEVLNISYAFKRKLQKKGSKWLILDKKHPKDVYLWLFAKELVGLPEHQGLGLGANTTAELFLSTLSLTLTRPLWSLSVPSTQRSHKRSFASPC